MKKSDNEFSSGRRETMKKIALGATAGLYGLMNNPMADARVPETPGRYKVGMPPVTIRSVKAIATAPEGSNLIVVKIETSEPGLYGLGCATFTQRAAAVITAINTYLA